MKVLALTEGAPYPPDTGWRLRTWNLLSRLVSNHDITVVCHAASEERSAVDCLREQGFGVVPVWRRRRARTGPRFYASLLLNLTDPRPYLVSAHRSRALQTQVADLLSSGQFDVVHCDWTPLAANLPARCGPPVVVTAHSIESAAWGRHGQHQPNRVRAAYTALQASKLASYERSAFELATRIVAVSDLDAETIAAWGFGERVCVVRNGTDTRYFRPTGKPSRDTHLVFVGSLDAMVNQDAVRWFARDILPRLRSTNRAVSVTIVGRRPPASLYRLAKEAAFTVAADPADVRPFIEEAGVYVVPLRIGGGTRLKILEAWAMERAVVSTLVGAEGLDARAGEDIVLADEPQEFADAVLALISSPSVRRRIGELARKKAVQQYDWASIAPALGDAWAQAAFHQRETRAEAVHESAPR